MDQGFPPEHKIDELVEKIKTEIRDDASMISGGYLFYQLKENIKKELKQEILSEIESREETARFEEIITDSIANRISNDIRPQIEANSIRGTMEGTYVEGDEGFTYNAPITSINGYSTVELYRIQRDGHIQLLPALKEAIGSFVKETFKELLQDAKNEIIKENNYRSRTGHV